MAEPSTVRVVRRRGLLALIIAGTCVVLMGAFVLLWIKLPAWAPAWVVEHSPWVDPIVRAVDAGNGGPIERASERLIARGPAVIPHLISLMRRDAFWAEHLAAAVFKQVRDDRVVEPLIAAILERNMTMSWQDHWVDALSAQNPSLVTDHLLPHLVTGGLVDPSLLELAGRLPDERLVPPLAAIMVHPWDGGTEDRDGRDRETAETAAEALVNSPCRSAVPSLIDAFASESATIRRRVVDGISCGAWAREPNGEHTLDERLQQILLAALDDADLSVRGTAMRKMYLVPIPGAVARLIGMSRSMDVGERRCAICALNPKCHGDIASRRIVEALHDEDDGVRLAAIEVLDRIDQFHPTSELLDLLASLNAEVRKSACIALYKVDHRTDPRLFPAFVRLMDDPVVEVFYLAHRAASFAAETAEMEDIVEKKFRARAEHLSSFSPNQ